MRKLRSFQAIVCSILLTMTLCAGAVSCSNDSSVSDSPGFTIEGASAETEYQVPEDRTIQLAGSGFQTGDAIRLTDTGLSGHYYTIRPVIEESGISMLLPKSFVSGQYRIDVIRGNKRFCYGKTRFQLESDDPEHPAHPDYGRLTAESHPRMLLNAEDFADIMEKVQSGNNAMLAKLHRFNIQQADISAANSTPLTYQLDAAGKRILAVSDAALMRIFSCAYAYRATGERKYLEHAENDINAVCDFSDWNAQRHFLDVGEMAAAVGLGYDWLYTDLSAETRAKAEQAICNYAFAPAEQGTWHSNIYNRKTNWNQVCNSGLVCGALAIYETCPARAKAIIEKSLESNHTAATSIYSPDGNYTEGYGYWGYGTIFQVLMLSSLETATGSDDGISKTKGFDRTSEWYIYMAGATNQCFNYSDNPTGIGASIPNWYFADKFKNPALLYNDLRLLQNASGWSDYLLPMIMAFAGNIDLDKVTPPTQKLWAGTGKTPVVLVHTDWTWGETDKYLGIKGGSASSDHAHMDAGMFVYDAYGVRWSMDMLRQEYAPLEVALGALGGNLWTMTQASMRWYVSRMNNLYHSTISVNEAQHLVTGSANLVQSINTKTELGGTFDLTSVLADQLSSAVRTVKLVDDKDLVVIDAIKARSDRKAKIRWTMVTPAVPTVESNRIILTQQGKTMYLTASSDSDVTIEFKTWSTDPVHTYDDPNPGVYRVGFEATVTAGNSATFTTTLSPEK